MAEKSLKKNAALNIVRSIMRLIFPLITFPYSSRVLLPDGIGKVKFAQSIVSYFALFAGLGISTYAVREASQIKENQGSLNKFCKEIFTINVISMSLSYSVLFVAILFVPKFAAMNTLLLICSLTILFNTLSMDWLFNALEEFTYITVRSIIFQIISLISLFVFVKTKDDYLKYAFLTIISSCGSGICNFFYRRKFISFKVPEKLNLRQHVKPVFAFFAMAAIINICTIFDTSMLGFLASETQVGYYAAATKINKLVIAMVTAACAVVLPRLSSLAIKDKEQFFRLTYKTISFVLMLSIPTMVGLSILTPQIIEFFCGEIYLPAIPTMRVMNPVILMLSLSTLFGGQFFVALKKEKYTIIAVATGTIINFTLNLILIPKYGAFGAGIATVIAESIVTISDFIMARKLISLKYIVKDFLQYILATIIMTTILLLELKFIENKNLIIIIGVLSGVLAYSITLILMKNQIIVKILSTIIKKLHKQKKE